MSCNPIPCALQTLTPPPEHDGDGLFGIVREYGFPVYGLTLEEKVKALERLLSFDHTQLLADMHVRQSMHGLALAWSYFPHAWGIRCGGKRTPLDLFHDDSLLARVLVKCRHLHGRVTNSTLRKTLRSFHGAQSVSNFRPSAAAAIYDRYLPDHGGVVWDMSAGFGGRLLGALACRKVKRYIGTDPASLTMEGLHEMRNELLPLAESLGRTGFVADLRQVGSEDFKPEPESLDLAFSSPPYFSTEAYSTESSQSHIKYPTRDRWLNGFMKRTLKNCHHGLKRNGRLIVNIAGVRSYPALEGDFVRLAEENGWRLEHNLRLCLSRMVGTRRGQSAHKMEPIFVFAKRR